MDELQNEKQSSANQSSSSSLPPDELQAQVQKLTGERDEYLDGWRRSKADFLNYKKEEAKRIEEVVSFGNLSIIKELIAVLDSFDLASSAFTHDEQARKGVEMIRGQFDSILKKHGVEKIAVRAGDEPDPRIHEMMSEIEVPQGKHELAGKIVDELASGYTLNGRVIRPAKVRVGKVN
jgi:molecular chaperone GrpE